MKRRFTMGVHVDTLFSVKHGLIAMGGSTSKTSSIFLLESKCGFGASIECKENIWYQSKGNNGADSIEMFGAKVIVFRVRKGR